MPRAILRLDSPHANAIVGALSPEIGERDPRTHVALDSSEGKMALNVDATDLSALRAALNPYLRWIRIAEDIGNMVGEEHG